MEVAKDVARKQPDHEELISTSEAFGRCLVEGGSCGVILSLGVALRALHCRRTSSQQWRIHWRGMMPRPAHCSHCRGSE